MSDSFTADHRLSKFAFEFGYPASAESPACIAVGKTAPCLSLDSLSSIPTILQMLASHSCEFFWVSLYNALHHCQVHSLVSEARCQVGCRRQRSLNPVRHTRPIRGSAQSMSPVSPAKLPHVHACCTYITHTTWQLSIPCPSQLRTDCSQKVPQRVFC